MFSICYFYLFIQSIIAIHKFLNKIGQISMSQIFNTFIYAFPHHKKNVYEHIRGIEWAHVFKNKSSVKMSENVQNLPNKLCIPKFNRPDQGLQYCETKTYC